MTQIITLANSETHATKSRGYPVLEAGNKSYPSGQYVVDFMPRKERSSFSLRHDMQNAELVKRLVREGSARYCCAVSSPVSSYRRVHFSEDATQEVSWSADDMGESPLLTPMVIAFQSRTLELCSDRDDVHPSWTGRTVRIDKGSRIAIGPVVQMKPTILHLLHLKQDAELADGTFVVDAESQPFRFVVTLSPGLHRFLQYNTGSHTRNHIMTHIVTACFGLLQRDFRNEGDEDGWQSDRNLVALTEYLDHKGLPTWTDSEFRPEEVATALYPHQLLDSGDNEKTRDG